MPDSHLTWQQLLSGNESNNESDPEYNPVHDEDSDVILGEDEFEDEILEEEINEVPKGAGGGQKKVPKEMTGLKQLVQALCSQCPTTTMKQLYSQQEWAGEGG